MKIFNLRKGQAAMEFLSTYGWPILAAIIAIGVLAYFGVFNVKTLTNSQLSEVEVLCAKYNLVYINQYECYEVDRDFITNIYEIKKYNGSYYLLKK